MMEWQTVNTVPHGRDIEIAVIESDGVVAVAHPCCLTEQGWIAAESKKRLYWECPTHWRNLSPKEEPIQPDRGPAFPAALL
jgi:hypothetical protein